MNCASLQAKCLTLYTVPGCTSFAEYFSAVVYDPYLYDDKPDFIPDNLVVFGCPAVMHSATPPHLRPYLLPEV